MYLKHYAYGTPLDFSGQEIKTPLCVIYTDVKIYIEPLGHQIQVNRQESLLYL